MPYFDAVIVNHKSLNYALDCLASLHIHFNGYLKDVYLIDNASGECLSRVSDAFPTCNIIRNQTNVGFATAVNAGICRTKAPYVMVVNPDTIVCGGSVKSLAEWLTKHPTVGVVGPRILEADGTVQGSARKFPSGLTGLFGRTSLISRIFPDNRATRDNIQTWKARQTGAAAVDWVSGAFMVVRRDAVASVGLLDERFFMYWEDADWCRRMWKKGWQVIYYTGLDITHFTGKSSRHKPVKPIVAFHMNAYRLVAKHGGWGIGLFSPLILLGLSCRLLIRLLMRRTQS